VTNNKIRDFDKNIEEIKRGDNHIGIDIREDDIEE